MSDATENSTPPANLELGDALSPKQAAFLLSIGVIDEATAARSFGFPDGLVPANDDQQSDKP